MATRDTSGTSGPNQKGSEPMGRMRNEATEVGQEAAQGGRETAGAARHRIRSLLEQQTHRAADQIGGVASALHQAAEQMQAENDTPAARYVVQAADRLDQVADTQRHSTVDDMVHQVERFARRQPEVFIGAAFAVGFLFARFVKSSGEPRRHGHRDDRMARSRGMGMGMGGAMGGDAMGSGTMGAGSAGSRAMGSGSIDTGTRSTGAMGGAMGGGSTVGSGAGSGRPDIAGGYPPSGALSSTATSTGAASSTTDIGRRNKAMRTRDAAELMAGGSPEPTPTASVPDETLGPTSAATSKPRETLR